MVLRINKILLTAMLSSVPFLLVAVIISMLFNNSHSYLGFILFGIGGIPIVCFSPGLISSSTSGAIHTPTVIYRKVNTAMSKKQSDDKSNNTAFFSSLNLVLVGVILWAISCFV